MSTLCVPGVPAVAEDSRGEGHPRTFVRGIGDVADAAHGSSDSTRREMMAPELPGSSERGRRTTQRVFLAGALLTRSTCPRGVMDRVKTVSVNPGQEKANTHN